METFGNQTKWFMQSQGTVQGPFSTTNLQNTLENVETPQLEQTLVWRRGLNEWIKASTWKHEDHSQLHTQLMQTQVTSNAPPSLDALLTPPSKNKPAPAGNGAGIEGAFYRVQVNFVDQPLMSRNDLLNLVAKQEDISVIAIQDPKSKEWKEVYAFPEIIEKLGLSRRKHPRVPILAQFTGRSNRHESLNTRIITISEGGIGFTENYELKIGDDVEGQISSPHFFQPIHIRADVVYAGLDGYIGLKFNQINDESQSAIIDYIKKFGKSTGQA